MKDQTSNIMLSEKTVYLERPQEHAAIGVQGLPEIALQSMIGKDLRDVFSHPVLNRHDLKILGSENGFVQKITINTMDDYLDIEEVAGMGKPNPSGVAVRMQQHLI